MSKTVLIVEDYADIRMIMKILVEFHGYHTIVASDGYEAVQTVKQFHPDLILMDIAMPIMDGITATRIIREFDDFPQIPIIAITAYGNLYHEKALKAGCDQVIDKPVDFDNLKPLLQRYLD